MVVVILVWVDSCLRIVVQQDRTREELQDHVRRHLRRLQKMPKLIQSFFQAPTTKYAAF